MSARSREASDCSPLQTAARVRHSRPCSTTKTAAPQAARRSSCVAAGNRGLDIGGPRCIVLTPCHLQPRVGEPRPCSGSPVLRRRGRNARVHSRLSTHQAIVRKNRTADGRCVAPDSGQGRWVGSGHRGARGAARRSMRQARGGRLGQEEREEPLGVKTARNHRFDNGKTRL